MTQNDIFRGCAKIRPVAFFKNSKWPPIRPQINKTAITPLVFGLEKYF
jgi:hypothetical protein